MSPRTGAGRLRSSPTISVRSSAWRRSFSKTAAWNASRCASNLDRKADEYVADIFGKQYTIVDRVAQLPAKLPQLFISLAK